MKLAPEEVDELEPIEFELLAEENINIVRVGTTRATSLASSIDYRWFIVKNGDMRNQLLSKRSIDGYYIFDTVDSISYGPDRELLINKKFAFMTAQQALDFWNGHRRKITATIEEWQSFVKKKQNK